MNMNKWIETSWIYDHLNMENFDLSFNKLRYKAFQHNNKDIRVITKNLTKI